MNDDLDAATLDVVPDALVVVGVDGTVRAANDLLARLVRRDRSALIGARAADAVPLQEEDGVDWWSCSALPTADPALLPRIAEQRLLLPRGGAAPVKVTVTGRRLPDTHGAPDALSVAVRRADHRPDVERRRSDLISMASHELRSPLTSIKGFTKTLLARWDRFDDATRRQMLATIDEDADRVTRLLTDLLDVSRIDSGRLPLQRQIVALADLVDPIARRFAVEHPDRPLHVDVPTDLPDVVVDRDRIGQVFVNLLDNAAKHGAGAVTLTAAADGDVVRCAVTDEGGSIPAADLRRVFVKYYRGQDRRTTGLGLGLYVSRGIVDAHGGRMRAESGRGVGTRLVFTLPQASSELAV